MQHAAVRGPGVDVPPAETGSATKPRSEHRVSSRSIWSDPVWHLDIDVPGRKHSDHNIYWDIALPDGTSLDEPQWNSLREDAKFFLWSLVHNPPPERLARRESGLRSTFTCLRVLIAWMVKQGFRHFLELDTAQCHRFISYVKRRRGSKGTALAAGTVNGYRNLLYSLYLHGRNSPETAIGEPFPGETHSLASDELGHIPHTPEALAVPLVSAALRLIEVPADDVIALRNRAQAVYDTAHKEGQVRCTAYLRVRADLRSFEFSKLPGESEPWQDGPVVSTRLISELVDRIVDAVFVVIAYLVGMRVSEILGLNVDCLEHQASADGTEKFTYITGRIYKDRSSGSVSGRPHRWVVPPPAERAINVLEALSEPFRARTGTSHLWLAMRGAGLLSEKTTVHVMSGSSVTRRLNEKFAPFVNLPSYQGKPWRLSPQQGRKTFARLVGRRDRTGLDALQAHYGHVTRAMTDRAYVGTDFELHELIDDEVSDETFKALVSLLPATKLAGKAGEMITKCSPFRGKVVDEELRRYIRFLMADTNFKLGICSWGYCLYRPETSACSGGAHGPNPRYRTESTCVSCANFAVTSKHVPYWENRLARNIALRDQPDLDPVSKGIAAKRIAECEQILKGIMNNHTSPECHHAPNGQPRPLPAPQVEDGRQATKGT